MKGRVTPLAPLAPLAPITPLTPPPHSQDMAKVTVDRDSVRGVAQDDGRCVLHGVQVALAPFGVTVSARDLDAGARLALNKRNYACGPQRGGTWDMEDVCRQGEAWSFDCVLESLKMKAVEIGRPITMKRHRDISVLTAPTSNGRYVVSGVLNRGVWGHPVTGVLAGPKSNPHDWHHVLVVDRDAGTILDSNSDGPTPFSASALASYIEEVWRVFEITVAL
jgi:hypothetical protein